MCRRSKNIRKTLTDRFVPPSANSRKLIRCRRTSLRLAKVQIVNLAIHERTRPLLQRM